MLYLYEETKIHSAILMQASNLVVYNMFSLAFLSGPRKKKTYIKKHIFQAFFEYNSHFVVSPPHPPTPHGLNCIPFKNLES